MLLLPADAHHHWGIQFLRQQRRNHKSQCAGNLAAKSPARIFADEDDVVLIHVHPACNRGSSLKSALSSCVKKQLAVLPVSHRGARLQALMAHIRRQKCFVQHQRCILEARIHIAIGPFFSRMAHWHAAIFFWRKIRVRPFQFGKLHRPTARLRPRPNVAVLARVRASGAQAFQRIDGKRQRLHFDLYSLDRFRASELIHGRHSQNRFALVHGLVGQRQFAPFVRLDHGSVVVHICRVAGNLRRR